MSTVGLAAQIVESQHVELRDDVPPELRPIELRYISPAELDLMTELAGYDYPTGGRTGAAARSAPTAPFTFPSMRRPHEWDANAGLRGDVAPGEWEGPGSGGNPRRPQLRVIRSTLPHR